MENLLTEHWKLLAGIIVGAFSVGVLATIYFKEGLRNLIFNSNGGIKVTCPLTDAKKTPMSKEEHSVFCADKWLSHEKASEGRWETARVIGKKDQEIVVAEIGHLKKEIEKTSKTVDKIFDKLHRKL